MKTVVHETSDGSYWMELIGNATITHLIEGSLTDLLNGAFEKITITETNEQKHYQEFLQTLSQNNNCSLIKRFFYNCVKFLFQK